VNNTLHAALAAATMALPTLLVASWVSDAKARVEPPSDTPKPQIVASAADVGYCTPELKKVLRRVLQSCGLSGAAGGRGCQPLEAKSVMGPGPTSGEKGGKKAGAVSGDDFNALFMPLSKRAGILQYDKDSAELDPSDTALLERLYADERGASYFFVVARSSPDGSVEHNRALSQARGEAALAHLRGRFTEDADLDEKVGLLWLGEEFAQLDQEFCTWQRSGDAATCQPEELNRSAFVAWIDCTL
jgi:outer membrane protein OmpA-like peptidoglycan-associated protein